MVPNAILVRTRLRRGATIWVAARAALALVLLPAGGNPLRLGAPAALVFVALCAIAGTLDEVRMGESVLISNLGVTRAWCVLLDAAPALAGELVMRFVWAVAG